jgi:hypothetical protein
VQAPLLQVSPLAHVLPQAPQLLGSEASFTHELLHNTCPAGQAAAVQTPPVQVPLEHCPADTQAPPFGRRGAQTPAVQKEKPGLQMLPQAPQLLLSVCSFVQAPLQNTCPPEQAPGQAPLVHAWPLGQAVPHAPQLEGSATVVVQKPLQVIPEQASLSPAACILYSTSRLASAPVFVAQVEPVRSEACSTSPAANVMTIAPVSDQFWPGVRTKS